MGPGSTPRANQPGVTPPCLTLVLGLGVKRCSGEAWCPEPLRSLSRAAPLGPRGLI